MPYAVDVQGLGEVIIPDDSTEIDVLNRVLTEKINAGALTQADNEFLSSLVEAHGQQAVQQPQEQPVEPVKEEGPDRGYFMEAMAGIGSGALHTLGAGLSGLERLAERADIDPTGEEAGWLRQAGEALKSGGEQIKASSIFLVRLVPFLDSPLLLSLLLR